MMKLTEVDYLISFNYIMEHMRKNDLDLGKTVKTLGTVELDEHHKEDLQFANEQELLIDSAYCLEHLNNSQYDYLKKEYTVELSEIEKLIQEKI
ncbi:TPA_asm: hypothetical protein GHE33_14605 [Listeria monocytogenes]|nr:hypothetical protein [Listeria monocytogenes]